MLLFYLSLKDFKSFDPIILNIYCNNLKGPSVNIDNSEDTYRVDQKISIDNAQWSG